mmetsp:Transcript_71953/g.217637  ORF Transcript_71953/g.217637 Transcript_71953/m.217637 type:complete len:106 (+) Transcript_71953:164-481(+)
MQAHATQTAPRREEAQIVVRYTSLPSTRSSLGGGKRTKALASAGAGDLHRTQLRQHGCSRDRTACGHSAGQPCTLTLSERMPSALREQRSGGRGALGGCRASAGP